MIDVKSKQISNHLDFRIISLLSNAYLGNGISASLHASVPLEVGILMKKGELDVTLKPHITALNGPSRFEVISGLVLPYTVRQSVQSIEPYDMAKDMRKILSRFGLKQV